MKTLIENKFDAYLDTLQDQAAAEFLREAVYTLPEDQRRAAIIKHLPESTAEENNCSNCDFDMGQGYENCGGAEDGVCPECGTEDVPMRQWNVPVMRIGYSHHLMAVSARTEQEAIDLAIDEAGGESFSEKSSEYSAPDGAMEIR